MVHDIDNIHVDVIFTFVKLYIFQGIKLTVTQSTINSQSHQFQKYLLVKFHHNRLISLELIALKSLQFTIFQVT